MPRACLILATMVLATLTAVALLAAGETLRPSGPSASGDRVAESRAAILAYYDAVNGVLASGDPAPLAAVLAWDYAEPDVAGMFPSGSEALIEKLGSLRATAPGLRLDVDWLVAESDRVAARVRVSGGDPAAFLSLALQRTRLWGPVDIFRVANGLVAERASAGDRPTLPELLVWAPVTLPPPAERVVTMSRVSLEPGGWRRDPAASGPRLIVVEAGEVAVTVAADGAPAALPGVDAMTLGAEEWRIVPEGAASAVRNAGSTPAEFLEVLVAASAAQPGSAAPTVEGATTRLLAGGQAATTPTGPAVLAVGRATFPPGSTLAWTESADVVLLVVEEGALAFVTEGDAAWVSRAAGGVGRAAGLATLTAGDGALIGARAGTELHNASDEQAQVVIVTLLGT